MFGDAALFCEDEERKNGNVLLSEPPIPEATLAGAAGAGVPRAGVAGAGAAGCVVAAAPVAADPAEGYATPLVGIAEPFIIPPDAPLLTKPLPTEPRDAEPGDAEPWPTAGADIDGANPAWAVE